MSQLFSGICFHMQLSGVTSHDAPREIRKVLENNGATYCPDPSNPRCNLIFVLPDAECQRTSYRYTGKEPSFSGKWTYEQICIRFAQRHEQPDPELATRKPVVQSSWVNECVNKGVLFLDNHFGTWEILTKDRTSRPRDVVPPVPSPAPTPADAQPSMPSAESVLAGGPNDSFELAPSDSASQTAKKTSNTETDILDPPARASQSDNGIFASYTNDQHSIKSFHVVSSSKATSTVIEAEGGKIAPLEWATCVIFLAPVSAADRAVINNLRANQTPVSEAWVYTCMTRRCLVPIDSFSLRAVGDPTSQVTRSREGAPASPVPTPTVQPRPTAPHSSARGFAAFAGQVQPLPRGISPPHSTTSSPLGPPRAPTLRPESSLSKVEPAKNDTVTSVFRPRTTALVNPVSSRVATVTKDVMIAVPAPPRTKTPVPFPELDELSGPDDDSDQSDCETSQPIRPRPKSRVDTVIASSTKPNPDVPQTTSRDDSNTPGDNTHESVGPPSPIAEAPALFLYTTTERLNAPNSSDAGPPQLYPSLQAGSGPVKDKALAITRSPLMKLPGIKRKIVKPPPLTKTQGARRTLQAIKEGLSESVSELVATSSLPKRPIITRKDTTQSPTTPVSGQEAAPPPPDTGPVPIVNPPRPTSSKDLSPNAIDSDQLEEPKTTPTVSADSKAAPIFKRLPSGAFSSNDIDTPIPAVDTMHRAKIASLAVIAGTEAKGGSSLASKGVKKRPGLQKPSKHAASAKITSKSRVIATSSTISKPRVSSSGIDSDATDKPELRSRVTTTSHSDETGAAGISRPTSVQSPAPGQASQPTQPIVETSPTNQDFNQDLKILSTDSVDVKIEPLDQIICVPSIPAKRKRQQPDRLEDESLHNRPRKRARVSSVDSISLIDSISANVSPATEPASPAAEPSLSTTRSGPPLYGFRDRQELTRYRVDTLEKALLDWIANGSLPRSKMLLAMVHKGSESWRGQFDRHKAELHRRIPNLEAIEKERRALQARLARKKNRRTVVTKKKGSRSRAVIGSDTEDEDEYEGESEADGDGEAETEEEDIDEDVHQDPSDQSDQSAGGDSFKEDPPTPTQEETPVVGVVADTGVDPRTDFTPDELLPDGRFDWAKFVRGMSFLPSDTPSRRSIESGYLGHK